MRFSSEDVPVYVKTCTACGRSFTREEWEAIPILGKPMVIPAWQDEPEEVLTLRNCPCGSTLATSSLGKTE